MQKILVADNSPRDLQRFRSLLEGGELEVELCSSGAEVLDHLRSGAESLVAIVLLWEIPGPPFGPELLVRSRRSLPRVPVVVVSTALDATLATRAFALGARDFLEKPLDMQRVKSCLDSLLSEQDGYSPLVEKLNKKILGGSSSLLSMLKQVARVIHHRAARVLLIGDSGTGKELISLAIHEFGANSTAPFVAVNVAAIPRELIESSLFGHERGAFTGAAELHEGYMEEAGDGTLFLDEIGELDLSLQAKLLRAIQEKKFRRLKGAKEIHFSARLVCATNRDLAVEVRRGTFRPDLFHRIAEVTIRVPSLKEREGDIDFLLEYFLSIYAENRPIRFARETLTILHSYPFPGNVRELENFVRRALIECDGELILPKHLPLPTMGVFLEHEEQSEQCVGIAGTVDTNESGVAYQDLFHELSQALPSNWADLPYKQAFQEYERAFDRIYLARLIDLHRHNVTRATKAAGVDKKTFAQHWKDAGLPPLRAEDGEAHE